MNTKVIMLKILGLMIGLSLFVLPATTSYAQDENDNTEQADAADENDSSEEEPELSAQNEDPNPTERDKNDENEIDVSDIADKYWRPQKDELEVVQNRRFAKSGRIEFSILHGFYQTREFSDSTSIGASLTYNFNELWAVEASYLNISNNRSDFLNSLATQFNVAPNFNTEESQGTMVVTFTPIYAKFALLGKHISHFEPYVSLGGGYTETLSNHFTIVAAFGNRFFITKNLVLRLEWKRTWYTDEVVANVGSFSTGQGGPGFFEDDIVRNNLIVGLGWLF